jgi:hypothetical protein
MNWNVENSFIVNKDNWRSLNRHNFHLFHQQHADRLKDYDGFVCFYPPSFSMMYENFDKPIILQVPIRFEVPFQHSREDLSFYVNHLQRTIKSGQLIPLANNRFDSEFCSDVVGHEFKLVPSICDYLHKTRSKSKNEVLIHGDLYNRVPNLRGTKRLTSGYTWDELYSYKAIVHIPYHNSIMSLFEQYTANMPLLFPSDKFLMSLWENDKFNTLSQISWLKIDQSFPRPLHKMSSIPDVNNYDSRESTEFIVKKSDWNDEEWMPFIVKYDSWEHLQHLIDDFDFEEIHEKMKSFNKDKSKKVLGMWDDVLRRI